MSEDLKDLRKKVWDFVVDLHLLSMELLEEMVKDASTGQNSDNDKDSKVVK